MEGTTPLGCRGGAHTYVDGLELSEICVTQRQALGTETQTKQSLQRRLGDLMAKAQLEDGRAEREGSSVLDQTEPHRKF